MGLCLDVKIVEEVPKGCLMEMTNGNFEVHVDLA